MDYKEFEEELYSWFLEKNNDDNKFTFSTRKKGTKGSETDIFIGTKKSSHIGMTFWTLPVSFPGSSSDFMNLWFIIKSNKISFYLQLNQTNSPGDNQNQLALDLINEVEPYMKERLNVFYESPSDNAMRTIKVGDASKQYESLTDLKEDLNSILHPFIKVLDEGIERIKARDNDFVAHRITLDEFQEMQKRLQGRLKRNSSINKLSSIVDRMRLKYSEELDKKFVFKSVNAGWVWIEDKVDEIKGKRAHYEIIIRKNSAFVELHFEDQASRTLFKSKIVDLPNGLEWFAWNKAHSIRVVDSVSIELENIEDVLFDKLVELESKIGPVVRRIIRGGMEEISKEVKKFNLNTILYGPPGTGKTYSTVDKVVEIVSPGEFKEGEHKLNKIIYDRLYDDEQVFFTTFHQSMGYEDFIEGIKPIPPSNKGEEMTYEVVDGLFKVVCEKAMSDIIELKSRDSNQVAELSFKQRYKLFCEAFKLGSVLIKTKTGIEVELTRITSSGNLRVSSKDATRGYTISANRLEKLVEVFESIDKVENIHNDIRAVIGGSNASLYYAVLKSFLDFDRRLEKEISEVGSEIDVLKLKLTSSEINALPKYVIVIDEINRGNVSQIVRLQQK